MRKEKRSIHFMVLFCAAVLLLCLSGAKLEAQAAEITASGTCGSNLTWTLDDEGTLTISGTGDMSMPGGPFYYHLLGSSISSVVIEDGVTSIGEDVFLDCVDLTSVTIPASVTSIGSSAFSCCSSLTSVTIPAGATSIGEFAFSGCSSLTSITIPDGVISIGEGAFSDCSSLTSITIPYSVTSIGDYAFTGCTSLTGIWVDPNNTTYSSDSDGTLFNKEKTQLIAVPGTVNGVYIIPEHVTSIGNYAFLNWSSLTSIIIPEGVTSIGDYAFQYCSSLISIAIPDGVTSIGEGTFKGCSSLTSVTIPKGVTSIDGTFYKCSSLTSITIPEGVTSIGGGAFYGCSNLASITIPEGVTSIGNYAFNGCSSLASITIPEGVTSIGRSAFNGCSSLTSIAIPDGVSSIDGGMFYGCSSLESITIPFVGGGRKTASDTYQYPFGYIFGTSGYTGGVATKQHYYGNSTSETTSATYYVPSSLKSVTVTGGYIPYGAFYNCSNLTSITIGNGVTEIGDYAFRYCSSLISIAIPDSVTSIGDYAFQYCSSLTGVTIPDGVTSIVGEAFYNCSSLTSISIPDSITSIGDYAFYGCSSLASITIPEGVTSIGGFAFESCSSLTSVTIPDSVTSIGDYAFYGCSSLTSITIPDSVTSISGYAFFYCSNLTSVTIGDSVTRIGDSAFYGCSNLTEIVFKGDAPSFNWDIEGAVNFEDVTATAYYPAGNDTWTEDVMQDYGGDITWVSYTLDSANPVKEWNLTLEDDLVIRFHLDADTLRFASLKLTVGDKIEKFRLSELEQTEDGQYIASINIAAAQMNDSITVQAVCGQQESELSSYTVRQYCDTVLADESYSEYHALVKEMLHYGAMAQLHFGYNAENLANAGITGVAAEEVPETAGEVTAAGKIDGVAFHGASLVYRDKIAVRCYFTGDVTGCSFTANGNTYTPVEKDGMHYVEIGDIPPQDLDQQLTLTVTDADGNELSVTYGPMDYMVRMNAKGSDTLKALMKALYNYHLAAKALRTTVQVITD